MKKIILFALFTTLIMSCNQKETSKKEVKIHAQLMQEMLKKPKEDIKTVGILLYDNYAVLDAMGQYLVG